MLQKQSSSVILYLERASSAREHALQAKDAELKSHYLDMEAKWLDLAASSAQVERVDLFLQSLKFSRLAPSETCWSCGRPMRLVSVEPGPDGQRYRFECRDCRKERIRRTS
ncbi:MAG TPA: hypothetical protein VHA77_12255 [Xanthobacteraceae bacterium]|jgi:hypothetical protein|nr:hypothetical protein [Xanthobacteraceae bacterium]